MSYATGSTPKGVHIADIDRDGILDVAAATIAGNYPTLVAPGAGVVTILYGAGDGTLGDRVDVSMGSAPFSIATGLLDGDDRVDLVTADWHTDGVVIRLGRSSLP